MSLYLNGESPDITSTVSLICEKKFLIVHRIQIWTLTQRFIDIRLFQLLLFPENPHQRNLPIPLIQRFYLSSWNFIYFINAPPPLLFVHMMKEWYERTEPCGTLQNPGRTCSNYCINLLNFPLLIYRGPT